MSNTETILFHLFLSAFIIHVLYNYLTYEERENDLTPEEKEYYLNSKNFPTKNDETKCDTL